MRVSQETSSDWWRHTATIDGQDVSSLHCVEADEEQGYIVCNFHQGRWDIPGDDGTPRTYTRYGKVVITPPDRLRKAALS